MRGCKGVQGTPCRNVLWVQHKVPLSYARLILCSHYIMQMAERNRAETMSVAMG